MTTLLTLRRDPAGRLARYAPAVLAWVALVLWLVANLLPGVVGGPSWEGPTSYEGWRLTLLGWDLALLADDGIALVGWTANVWLILAVGVRVWHLWLEPDETDHLVAAAITTAMTVGCALLAVVALARSEYIVSIEVGTWVWIASIGVFALSTTLWAIERRLWDSPAPRIEPAEPATMTWLGPRRDPPIDR
jgi:hypothetical protein